MHGMGGVVTCHAIPHPVAWGMCTRVLCPGKLTKPRRVMRQGTLIQRVPIPCSVIRRKDAAPSLK
jgi:hypothetical protein